MGVTNFLFRVGPNILSNAESNSVSDTFGSPNVGDIVYLLPDGCGREFLVSKPCKYCIFIFRSILFFMALMRAGMVIPGLKRVSGGINKK